MCISHYPAPTFTLRPLLQADSFQSSQQQRNRKWKMFIIMKRTEKEPCAECVEGLKLGVEIVGCYGV
ncbi:hypothetical protein E2C01_009884 [Portunus trituberculatus]|uniref:Uncharacterized protein n=1 Tax=Portunus trituberculatus TaxID=210409 RepID=A0A5B7D6Y3_PORTR|nr:hypothetical protein [Portunus trituberculatus]